MATARKECRSCSARDGRLRAVVFDFDGTLADTRIDFARMRRYVFGALRELDLWEDDLEAEHLYVLEIIQAAADRAPKRGVDPAAVWEAAEARLREVEVDACARASLCEGVPEALEALGAAGLRLGMITRNCSEAVELVLRRFDLPLEVQVPRDVAREKKPKPGHLRQALEGLGVQPSQAALVGDHVTDMQCALAAGALAVAVAGASSSAEELQAAGADFVAHNITEAAGYLLARARGEATRG